MRNPWKNKGFTLLEMMMTIAIVGVLSGIGWTFLHGNSPKNKLRGGVDQLYTDLQDARMNAITRNVPMGIHFDAGFYAIFEDLDHNRVRNANGFEDRVHRRFPDDYLNPAWTGVRFFSGRGFLMTAEGDSASLRAVICLDPCRNDSLSMGVYVNVVGVLTLLHGTGASI